MPDKKAPFQNTPLSTRQRDAIRLLASGCTVRYTALALKLKAGEIGKWMKQDTQFQSELAAQVEQQRAQASVNSKLETPKETPKAAPKRSSRLTTIV